MLISEVQTSELEKMRKRILEKLALEELSSHLVIKSRRINGKKITEIKDESTLPKYDIQDQKYNIKQKLYEIVKIVISHHPFGISHNDLSERLNIDRSNLTKYIEQLSEKQIVIRNNSVKDGPYIISPKILNNNTYAMGILYFQQNLLFALAPYEIIDWEKIDKIKQNPENREEKKLFEFSNNIGAIFTYLCLFAMNPENEIAKYGKNEQEKELLIMSWIQDMVSRFCLDWFKKFQGIIPFCLKSMYGNVRDEMGENYEEILIHLLNRDGVKRGNYIHDYKIINELQEIFKNVYPAIYEECESAKKDVGYGLSEYEKRKYKSKNHSRYGNRHVVHKEQDILWYERITIYKKYKIKVATLCDHKELIEPTYNPYNHEFIRHCQHCHKTFYDKSKIK